MKDVFLAIQAYLLSKLADYKVEYIRVWNNQIQSILQDDGQLVETFPFPAIFVEFPDEIPYDQIGNGVQTVDPLMIRLHILYDFYDAQDETMGQNLVVLQMAQDMYRAFQDWMPEIPLGVMVRKSEYHDKDHPNVYHFIQEYQTTWIDVAMNRPVGGISSVPVLDYELDIVPVWAAGNLYIAGTYVSYTADGIIGIYQCILNTTVASEPPTNTHYWTFIRTA